MWCVTPSPTWFCTSISSPVSVVLLGCCPDGHGTRSSICVRSLPSLQDRVLIRYRGLWVRGSHPTLLYRHLDGRTHPVQVSPLTERIPAEVWTTNQVGWIIMQELRPCQPRRKKAHPTSRNSHAIPSASHLDPETNITRPSIHTAKNRTSSLLTSTHGITLHFRSTNLGSLA